MYDENKFDENKFLSDLKNTNFPFTSADPNENSLFFTNSFSKIVEKHGPLKKKTLRRNHAPFLSKELRKAIFTRSRFRSRYLKNPDENNKTVQVAAKQVPLYSEKINQTLFF